MVYCCKRYSKKTPNYFFSIEDILKEKVLSVRPGLSGIGSIIFRNEEEFLDKEKNISFHDKVLTPYKIKLELWYIDNNNIYLYFKLIILTVISIFFSNLNLHWKVLRYLPVPPDKVKSIVGFKNES